MDWALPQPVPVVDVDEEENDFDDYSMADDYADAEARAGGSHGNKGEEAALVVIEMANLIGKLA